MNICLVGSILRHRVITEKGEFNGWGGMTESAVAPFAALLGQNSVLHFVGKAGSTDLPELRSFYQKHYPLVDASGIGVNPAGTDFHYGTKDFSRVTLKMEPVTYEDVEPFTRGTDVVIFNFGNVDDIDPEAISLVKKKSGLPVYVDVHRKPFGADRDGYIYSRGWPGWEKHLQYADAVQMNKNECEALFRKENMGPKDILKCASRVLDAGPGLVFITLRDKGVLVGRRVGPNDREYFLTPAIPPRTTVDLTGCGDAFAAGYLVGLHEGKSLTEALKLASATASLNCEFLGYMRGAQRFMIDERLPSDFEIVRLGP